MTAQIIIQPDRVTVEVNSGETTELRDILAAVDHHYQYDTGGVAGVRRNGSVVAWNEAVAGPAPGGVSQTAKDRGVLIEAARSDWEGDPPRTLKAGAQTLLDQWGA